MTVLKYKPIGPYRATLLIRLILELFLFATIAFQFPTFPQSLESIGKLANIIGKAEILRAGKNIPAEKNMQIFETDIVTTFEKTAIKIEFNDGSYLMAFQDSKIKLAEYNIKAKENNANDLKSAIEVAKGKIRFFVKPQEDGKVDAKFKTSNSVMGIRGTSGYIDTSAIGNTQILVTSGSVEVTSLADPTKSVVLSENKYSEIIGNRPPTPAKTAPPMLINRLNAEASLIDPNYKQSEKPAPKPEGAPKKDKNPSKGSNDNNPVPAEKKQVFNTDGTSTVVSTNNALNDVLVTQGNSRLRPSNITEFAPIVNALKEINNVNDQINRQINTIINTSSGYQKTKNVTVNVNDPSL
ncbi:FecR family protein [Fluviispira vulneris]|uniref:FecR family protein n=1 Tax=Fluviispira vulneris TaxID=2763012 RepID=UPI001648BD7A|nr:FecR domain-containing protein [Fluviispira vulneris]